ncbi:hypothetical protein FHX74_002488 [Friedmanniella endophytica]|uniref:Uncharacterized protein n=1 Tax=Microlunatus kandeliicorticis TaxID=1759536 RepID=A0A7W3ITG7_9ACTN|nr:hypothetical protein [Microlunatus kandeliicorticis]MBA8794860.1 hypothetical protein [Microlunatus kandeliicorticis]
MGPLRETDQTSWWTTPSGAPATDGIPAPAVGPVTGPLIGPVVDPAPGTRAPQPSAAELAALVRGPVARTEIDPGSWGLLLVPVIVSVALVVAVWLAF